MSRKRTRQSPEERLRKQARYQADLRRRQLKAKAPGRDDIARALFYHVATESLGHPEREAKFLRIMDMVVDLLVSQGFDRKATDVVLAKLLDRYEDGWAFRRKAHLVEKPMRLEELIG